jgi:hypothetical protein
MSGDKWQFSFTVLAGLTEGGGEARRALRQFIGAWLSERLLESPSNTARRQVVERLHRQGWHVKDGVLVIGARSHRRAVACDSALSRAASVLAAPRS